MTSNTSSLDGETTASSEILWSEILSRIPFVKNDVNIVTIGSDRKTENKVRIDSKNEVEEEDALQLEQWICNQEVLISHSCTMQPLQYCRGIVEDFEYQKKNLKVTVSSESEFPIWEDTDIWMVSTPNSSIYNPTEPNTSVADLDPIQDEKEQISLKDAVDEEEEPFESIIGWRLVSKSGHRYRRKYGEVWKNVYITELEMTPVDPSKMNLLKNIKLETSLRFSDDIEEPGDVLMDVVRMNLQEGSEFTIILGVTGFASNKVDIPIRKDSTYYLTMYHREFDDMGSVASEPEVLSGYPLKTNIDEQCEKLGELTVTAACIKTWKDMDGNVPYIRLTVTSRRNMKHFKMLVGHHIAIQSENCTNSVLAIVNKVMSDEMVITLKGVRRTKTPFLFSKIHAFTIHIDESYEESLQQLTGDEGFLENLRQQILREATDIRLHRVQKITYGTTSKYYASFTTKNEAFTKIPLKTRVLIGKCWEIESQPKTRADFVFGIRVDDSVLESIPKVDLKVTFEIIYGRNLVENTSKFEMTKAFYHVDFDSYQDIARNTFYSPLNACDTNCSKQQSVANMKDITRELKFEVFPLVSPSKHVPTPKPLPPPSSSISLSSSQNDEKTNNHCRRGNPHRKSLNNNNNKPVQENEEVHKESQKTELKKQELNPKLIKTEDKATSTTPPKSPMIAEKIANSSKKSAKPPVQNEKSLETHKSAQQMLSDPEPWKRLGQLDKKNHRRLCYVYITKSQDYRDDGIVKLRAVFDDDGKAKNNKKSSTVNLGWKLSLTTGDDHTEVKINGEVTDTKDLPERHFNFGRQENVGHRVSEQIVVKKEEKEQR